MFKNSNIRRRPPQLWGNTEFPDDQRNKRVFVKAFDPETITIDDLLNFFGRDSIVGIRIVPTKGHARIQFKRPSDQTGAIAKHKMQLKGRTIIVEPDHSTSIKKQRVTPPSCKNNLMAQRTSREPPTRHHSSSRRSRSRSPRRHRSRDRSSERGSSHRQQYPKPDLPINDYAGPSQSYQLQPARFHVPNFQSDLMPGLRPADPFVGDSVMNNYTGVNAQVAFPPADPKPAQPFFQTSHVMSHQQYVAPQPALPAITNGIGGLPSSINLALQLVVSHNSVRNLSIEQLQDVIDYFQAEKRFLLQKYTDANTNTSQVPQHSQQIVAHVPQQQPDVNQQVGASEESQVDPKELESLDSVLRSLREANR